MKQVSLIIFFFFTMFSASAQGLPFLLGLRGNVYRTEVDIPIKAVRYDDGSGSPRIKTYSVTTSSNIKTVTTVTPNSESTVAPDGSSTTETVITGIPVVIGPVSTVITTKAVTTDDITAGTKKTTITSTTTTSAITTNSLPYIRRRLRYTLLAETKTGTPLITVKPIVRFVDDAGTVFIPTNANPFPPEGYHLEVRPSGGTGAIKSAHYVFQPDNDKMPNYSQLLMHEWFVGGPFSALIKRRPRVKAHDQLADLEPDWFTGVSLSFVTGSRHNLFPNNRFARAYRTQLYLDLPIIMAGVSTVEVKNRLDSNGDGLYDTYAEKQSRVAATIGTGVGIQVWKFAFMPVIGWDFLLGTNTRAWPYQGKTWVGGNIGISLDKLIGSGK